MWEDGRRMKEGLRMGGRAAHGAPPPLASHLWCDAVPVPCDAFAQQHCRQLPELRVWVQLQQGQQLWYDVGQGGALAERFLGAFADLRGGG